MRTSNHIRSFAPSLLALAVLGTIGQAGAQQSDEVRQLTNPESSVRVGGASVSGDSADRAQFGMFNGMRKERGYLLLDLDYLTRDNATGLWTFLTGRNLGLDSRELRGGMQKQGDWKVFGEYNEITRYSPFTVNTAMTGVGTSRPNIVNLATPGTGSDYDFRLQRKAVSAGFEKNIGRNLKFEASARSEDKTGTRLWGRGYDCAAYVCGFPSNQTANQSLFLKNAILLIPEPIDSTIKQFEAKLAYHNDRMSLVAGYYGSFYTNSNGNISPTVPNSLYGGNGTLVPSLYPALPSSIIPGSLSLQSVLQSAMALPPDNQAHQFSIAGNYALTRSTKATFKYSVTRMKQDESFSGMGLDGAPAGFSNLGGKVDGVNAQLGLTSRITRDLNVLANFTYLKNEDKTPKGLYNVEAKAVFPATVPVTYTNVNQPGIPGATWFNNHTSKKDVSGKLEGTYRLPDGLRLTLGADYRERHRDVPESRVEEALGGLGPLREKNTETTYRIDLRRSMSETLNGSIGYSTSERKGSDWTNLSTL
ncbi:MAG TPA: MtrB/PioB family outer membrane beta-barrel protein, partial [Usitatibacteraceae bacterium]|nr:MtrB/PioB family outer membrane beta-barrel protein [Usitatibacteraceae bacterium]